MTHGRVPGIQVGTSGWHYEHWRGRYYPQPLTTNRWLAWYARDFTCVEVNNSFYRLPTPATVAQWCRQTPKGFKFAVKASRLLTHMKKLKDCRQPLEAFLQGVAGFKAKLGPILFQLPPRWHLNLTRFVDFIEQLPGDKQYAFEFRDPSWHCQAVYEVLQSHRLAFCMFDLAGWQSDEVITSQLIYLRLHGPGAAYCGNYSMPVLENWAAKVVSWFQAGHEVYVFFDNDQNAYAVHNARALQQSIVARLQSQTK